jgi:hypothetical protein
MKSISVLVAAAGLAMASAASADNILFIEGAEGGHPYSDQASNNLVSLGHNVTLVQNPQNLNTYLQYDQIWDFRYNTQMTNQDGVDMGAYLQAGGRMLVLGEHSGFEGSRNISLRNWINQVGGGQIGNYVQSCATDFEATTVAGQIVMQPNPLAGIQMNCATTYNNPGTGFLVVDSGGGDGGVIGWNFGDLVGAPGARLLACWDIEQWQSGLGQDLPWTENCATYLSRVPAPGSVGLLGLAGLVAARRRRA